MEKGLDHLYTTKELDLYLKLYNEVFDYLKLVGNFWLNDKIIDIKRWLIFDDSEQYFWDYLDETHEPVKKMLGEYWWFHCIKFVLNNWSEFILAENPSETLPKWVHSIQEYIWELDKYQSFDTNSTYTTKIFNKLWEIMALEHEYFRSEKYLSRKQKSDMFYVLNLKKSI